MIVWMVMKMMMMTMMMNTNKVLLNDEYDNNNVDIKKNIDIC